MFGYLHLSAVVAIQGCTGAACAFCVVCEQLFRRGGPESASSCKRVGAGSVLLLWHLQAFSATWLFSRQCCRYSCTTSPVMMPGIVADLIMGMTRLQLLLMPRESMAIVNTAAQCDLNSCHTCHRFQGQAYAVEDATDYTHKAKPG